MAGGIPKIESSNNLNVENDDDKGAKSSFANARMKSESNNPINNTRNDINFTNILNRRPASSASNADKNRGHRIDCLLCQITGNNDAEMGVEGGGTRYLTAGITDKEDDLTVVNGTEYLTAGNNNEVVGGCNVRRLRNIQWDQSKDVDLAGLYFTAKFVAKLC